MRTFHEFRNAKTAVTRKPRGLGSFFRRPLFVLLTVFAAGIRIAVWLAPPEPVDYEPYRRMRMTLTGTVSGLEPKQEDGEVIWRMTLSDVEAPAAGGGPAGGGPEGGGSEGGRPEGGGSEGGRPEGGGSEGGEPEGGGPEGGGSEGGGPEGRSPGQDRKQSSENSIGEETTGTGAGEETIGPVPEEEFTETGTEEQTFCIGKKDQVLCILDHEPAVEMSARVRVTGTVFPFQRAYNAGEFDSRLYYHILRVAFSMRDVRILAASGPADPAAAGLYRCKRHLAAAADRVFSERNAPILRAVLLGEKGLLEEETKELYQSAGIIHILSISGLHLSLIGTGLYSLLGRLHRGRLRIPAAARAAASITAVVLYGKMTGMGTSVFRALVMLSLHILAGVIGRTYDILTAAGIAAVLVLLDQPLYLLHTGFLFSFSAVLSMGILLPALPGRRLKMIAVPAGTLPVCLWTYGTFPLWSLLLNLIVIPLMAVVMVSGGSAVFLCQIADALPGRLAAAQPGTGTAFGNAVHIPARLAARPGEWTLDLYRFLAGLTARLPGHEIVAGRPAVFRICLYYLMLILLAALSSFLRMPHIRRRIETAAAGRKRPFSTGTDTTAAGRKRPFSTGTETAAAGRGRPFSAGVADAVAGLCILLRLRDNRARRRFGIVCSAVWMVLAAGVLVLHRPPAFEMDFLYVGQGDGILVRCGEYTCLIDGGSSSRDRLARYTLIPFLHARGIGRLDGVFLTHDDIDHCSGLMELLEEADGGEPAVRIDHIYLPDIAEAAKGQKYRRIEDLAAACGIPVTRISRGMRLRAGLLTMDCLHPPKGASYEDANEYSTTLLVRYDSAAEERKSSFLESSLLKSSSRKSSSRRTSFPDADSRQAASPGAGTLQSPGLTDPSTEEFTALLTGDLEGQGEADLCRFLKEAAGGGASGDPEEKDKKSPGTRPDNSKLQSLPGTTDAPALYVDLLKVAHHGSRNATSEDFLSAVDAGTAVISSGIRNLYGHPHEEVLQRLSDAGIPCHRTDQSGTVTVLVKKGTMQISRFVRISGSRRPCFPCAPGSAGCWTGGGR